MDILVQGFWFLVRQIQDELKKSPVLYALAILGAAIAFFWLKDLETRTIRITCATIETDLGIKKTSIQNQILLSATHTISEDNPAMQTILDLDKRYQSYITDCPSIVKPLTYLKNIREPIKLYANNLRDAAFDKLSKMDDDSVLYHHFYAAAALYKYKQANVDRKRQYKKLMINQSRQAYKKAEASIIGPNRGEILTKLRCNWKNSEGSDPDEQLECMKELLGANKQGGVFFNMSEVYVEKEEWNLALEHFQKFLDSGVRICKEEVEKGNFQKILKHKDYGPRFKALVGQMRCD